jgi:trk system potassium uptake protein TrkA
MAGNQKDICVIGTGRFGTSVIEQLIDMQRYVLAIDLDESRLVQVSRIANQAAIADGSDIEGLKGLGLQRFSTVIVGVSDNIEIIAALLELGVNHIIAKAKSVRHQRVLEQIGVEVIIRPEAEAGVRAALIATNQNFIKYSESLQEIGDGYAIGSTVLKNEK